MRIVYAPDSPRRRRVLMLTTNARLDQRLLHDAAMLTAFGAEVIVLAAAAAGLPPYEILGGVKIHRLPAPPLDAQPPGLITHACRLTRRLNERFIVPLARRLAAILPYVTRRSPPFWLSALEQDYFREGLFYRPDIIHVHDLGTLPAAMRLKEALPVQLIYNMHESQPDQPRLAAAG